MRFIKDIQKEFEYATLYFVIQEITFINHHPINKSYSSSNKKVCGINCDGMLWYHVIIEDTMCCVQGDKLYDFIKNGAKITPIVWFNQALLFLTKIKKNQELSNMELKYVYKRYFSNIIKKIINNDYLLDFMDNIDRKYKYVCHRHVIQFIHYLLKLNLSSNHEQ